MGFFTMVSRSTLVICLLWPCLSLAQSNESKNLQELINDTRTLRSLVQSDPHRPIYHFVAPEGHEFPFDPNGAIYWRGKYHLGYLHQKEPTKYVWGHAVSTDLLHWTLYPNMIDVGVGDTEHSIFSGGAFLSKEGVPHVIYHEWGASANLIAYAMDEDLRVWKKSEADTALRLDHPDESSAPFTVLDPDAWYDEAVDAYYQISGGKKPALFKSKDMRKWSYLGDLIDKKNTMRNADEDLSCPDYFSLGNDKFMLLFISHNWGAQYYIGTFSNDKFSVEQHARMNWPGGSFFAPEQLQDDKGRNIIWGWVWEHKPPHVPDYGWSGIMSLPRVVSLGDDGKLRIDPVDEIKAIRTLEVREKDIELAPGSERLLTTQGRSIELQLEISGAERSSVGVKVFASPDGREETTISFDPVSRELVVNFSKSSVRGPVTIPASIWPPDAGIVGYPRRVFEQRAPLKIDKGEPLKLNIFLDRSVIEVFANGVQCITQVVYPELEASTRVKVFSGDEAVTVRNIQSWTMAETNPH